MAHIAPSRSGRIHHWIGEITQSERSTAHHKVADTDSDSLTSAVTPLKNPKGIGKAIGLDAPDLLVDHERVDKKSFEKRCEESGLHLYEAGVLYSEAGGAWLNQGLVVLGDKGSSPKRRLATQPDLAGPLSPHLPRQTYQLDF